jgi:hypothetical protein
MKIAQIAPPVIAFRSGSTPEVIDDGVTGFVDDSIDQAVEAVLQAKALNRPGVRATFERRFTGERMARGSSDLSRAPRREYERRLASQSRRWQRRRSSDCSLNATWPARGGEANESAQRKPLGHPRLRRRRLARFEASA